MRHQSDLGAAGAPYFCPPTHSIFPIQRWQYDEAGDYWTKVVGGEYNICRPH